MRANPVWSFWFAWHPIEVEGRWVWRRWVMRRWDEAGSYNHCWVYRFYDPKVDGDFPPITRVLPPPPFAG